MFLQAERLSPRPWRRWSRKPQASWTSQPSWPSSEKRCTVMYFRSRRCDPLQKSLIHRQKPTSQIPNCPDSWLPKFPAAARILVTSFVPLFTYDVIPNLSFCHPIPCAVSLLAAPLRITTKSLRIICVTCRWRLTTTIGSRYTLNSQSQY